MQSEFPYQIVTFLDRQPNVNEPVYSGKNDWYPQVAIKRRFRLTNITEEAFTERLRQFFASIDLPLIETGKLTKPERMPVQVIHIANQDDLKQLHIDLIDSFSAYINSKFPEREGGNYYPHITAEYDGKFVIPVDEYENKSFSMNNVWLLKDVSDDNSLAFAKIR